MVAAGLGLALVTGAALTRGQEIEYGRDPNADKRMTLLLKDFAPKSMLHVPRQEVTRAKLQARQAELGRQPRRALKFFADYQDRVLFGTDSEPEEAMYANYFRWRETADEYFPYGGYPGQGRGGIYGMELPNAVLEKVYHKNAEKILAEFRGAN